jgi:hypothetical protein
LAGFVFGDAAIPAMLCATVLLPAAQISGSKSATEQTDQAADPDLEPVRIVVAAIALVAMNATDRDTCEPCRYDRTEGVAVVQAAMQRFGVQHELPALRGGDRRGV